MMLGEGEQPITQHGNKTTPFPKLNFDSNRKTINTVKRVDEWLRKNAIIEAELLNDEFNTFQFKNTNTRNLSQADKDGFHLYLFGTIY